MKAPHTPHVRAVRSHDLWDSPPHSTASGWGAPVTCHTPVSWWGRAWVASNWVRLSLKVTKAVASGDARVVTCFFLISAARNAILSTQYWTASTLVDALASTPYWSRAQPPARAPRTVRVRRLTSATPRRF